jgi:hypothetical protein
MSLLNPAVLIAFLRDRLDEDAHGAAAATPGPWRVSYAFSIDSPTRNVADEAHDGDITEGDALHIVRHDPTRVAGDVDSQRRIIDRLEVLCAGPGAPWGWSTGDHARREVAIEMLFALTSQFSSHPEYREEW